MCPVGCTNSAAPLIAAACSADLHCRCLPHLHPCFVPAGLTRQYLLPMPSGRQKFEEPTFRPAIDPRSQVGSIRWVAEGRPVQARPGSLATAARGGSL